MKSRQLSCAAIVPRANHGQDIVASIWERYSASPSRIDGHAANPDRHSGDGGRSLDLGLARHELYALPVPSQKGLQQLFDLTAAEAKLAQLIACGDSVEEVAQTLNVKMTTARTQLAAVFAKTETRRQAKLVALLSRIAHLEERAARADRLVVIDSAQREAAGKPLHLA